ncbi:MAG TPA: spore cortex biosynthesis protein YabQ [Bacilli bacterium]
MTLPVQFQTLWAMAACGFVLGLCFDIYRVCSRQLHVPRWLIPAFDLLYWAAAAVLVFRVLTIVNSGQVRLFVFAGLFAGGAIYFATISKWAILMVKKAIAFAFLLGAWLRKAGKVLFIIPLKGLWRLLWLFGGFFLTVSVFVGKIMLQLLYPVRILFAFLLRPFHRLVYPVRGLRKRLGAFAGRLKKILFK